MKLNEIDEKLMNETDWLNIAGQIGGAFVGSQLRRAVNDRLPKYKKGGLRRTTAQRCKKVNGRQVCDYSADVGFDLPTIQAPKAMRTKTGRQPSIDILNVDTANSQRRRTR